MFHGLLQLVDALPTLEPDGEWIYVNPTLWQRDPLNVDYYFVPERWIWTLREDDVFTDEEGLEMPRSVEGLGLISFKTIFDLKHLAGEVPDPGDGSALVDLIQERSADRAGWAKRPF